MPLCGDLFGGERLRIFVLTGDFLYFDVCGDKDLLRCLFLCTGLFRIPVFLNGGGEGEWRPYGEGDRLLP